MFDVVKVLESFKGFYGVPKGPKAFCQGFERFLSGFVQKGCIGFDLLICRICIHLIGFYSAFTNGLLGFNCLKPALWL